MHRIIGYDAPFQFMQRRTKTDLEIAGTEIAAGEAVWIILGAANPGLAKGPWNEMYANRTSNFGNGRDVRTIYEKIIRIMKKIIRNLKKQLVDDNITDKEVMQCFKLEDIPETT